MLTILGLIIIAIGGGTLLGVGIAWLASRITGIRE